MSREGLDQLRIAITNTINDYLIHAGAVVYNPGDPELGSLALEPGDAAAASEAVAAFAARTNAKLAAQSKKPREYPAWILPNAARRPVEARFHVDPLQAFAMLSGAPYLPPDSWVDVVLAGEPNHG